MTDKSLSPLQQTVAQTPTDYWNDSCSIEELSYGVSHGAVGATTNPTIVLGVLKKEMHLWRDRIGSIIAGNPTWSEVEVSWKLIEEMAVAGSKLLIPAYERYQGRKGRLSIQTNPALYRDPEALVRQAVHFSGLAPNMQVKLPVTAAGVRAIEEATFQGVSINATVSFTVPQSIAVAEAVERGLDRRAAKGLDISRMSPVCTIMVGRTDDWMQVVARRDSIDIDPAALTWAGIATFKKAYDIFLKRGYRSRLLVAAYRHMGHCFEMVGGEVILSMPYEWARKFNDSPVPDPNKIRQAVDPAVVDELYRKVPDFRRGFDEGGMEIGEFDGFGATVRTLRSFTEAVHDVMAIVRDFMLPNPDVKQA